MLTISCGLGGVYVPERVDRCTLYSHGLVNFWHILDLKTIGHLFHFLQELDPFIMVINDDPLRSEPIYAHIPIIPIVGRNI